jgi:hypothetical protein
MVRASRHGHSSEEIKADATNGIHLSRSCYAVHTVQGLLLTSRRGQLSQKSTNGCDKITRPLNLNLISGRGKITEIKSQQKATAMFQGCN